MERERKEWIKGGDVRELGGGAGGRKEGKMERWRGSQGWSDRSEGE